MKKQKIDHQTAPPVTPTAKQALTQFAARIRKLGITLPLPMPVTGPSDRGLALALIMVEEEVNALASAEPQNNQAHRALFALPPIQASASTSTDVAVPELPAQKVVTGDQEVDAVLWLREVINTGQADLIDKARLASARIVTPLKDLEKRYTEYLVRTNPGNWTAAFSSFGFADLDELAERAVQRAMRQREVHARFGDAIFADTPAEVFCSSALADLTPMKNGWDLEKREVDQRFDAASGQRPGTLFDCVLELTYWNDLYWLRNAESDCDHSAQVSARQDYVFRCLSRIPPRDPGEAAEVLRYLVSNDGMDRAQTGAILMNLVGAPEPYRAHGAGGNHE